MDSKVYNKIGRGVCLALLFYVNIKADCILKIRWPKMVAAVNYKVYLGDAPKTYYFSAVLEPKNYYFKDGYLYCSMYLKLDDVAYYMAYSYTTGGAIEYKSGDLKIRCPIIFPQKPKVKIK